MCPSPPLHDVALDHCHGRPHRCRGGLEPWGGRDPGLGRHGAGDHLVGARPQRARSLLGLCAASWPGATLGWVCSILAGAEVDDAEPRTRS
ncbi:hypothetical protein SORBI_3004G177900 [Sorghum bicolor]|uniref:Uncharacterized protein n=1 Tax=Sorghum bicolor TaxID=4558 RepID=A0A194YQF0_SORBI|nr:hypothetical protein SORBI_3004G177900 [Sorghum bicolor]KXG30421.1 hypothetical protein SORBI_3004G177900 [Sorghum bicolor]